MILGLSEPGTRSASMRSLMPSSRGTENPQMSASSTPTVKPRSASAVARLTVHELLPTPPLPLAIASTWQVAGTALSGAFERACQRALLITSARSSAFISPHSMRTSVTPGWRPTRCSTSRLMSARSGQPPIVSLMPIVTVPSVPTSTPGTMPSDTMSAPSSGSITVRRTSSTSAGVGGAGRASAIQPGYLRGRTEVRPPAAVQRRTCHAARGGCPAGEVVDSMADRTGERAPG